MNIETPVTIMLDKPRTMRLTLGGMKKFQEVTGKSLLKGFDMSEMDESDLIALIWACLVWEDKELKVDDVGYMLNIGQIPEVTQKLAQAINTSLPDKKDNNPNPQNLPT